MTRSYLRERNIWPWLLLRLVLITPAGLLAAALGVIADTIEHGLAWLDHHLPEGSILERVPLERLTSRERVELLEREHGIRQWAKRRHI
ncbi:MAG: hypothetical protein RLZZ515_2044 [Cyanobacteriota bacterium]|jgi:hypothetical protein